MSSRIIQYYVYNIMDNQRAEYVKQNGHQRTSADVNDALWNKALRENPDPARYYPHLIVGHDALKKRVGQQDEFAAKHAGKLEVWHPFFPLMKADVCIGIRLFRTNTFIPI